jgi:cell division initiation protein
MKLTPLDIRHKEFKRGMRGYTDVEVDEFLDEVADEFERLFKENIDLNERVETLLEKVSQYRRIEETLQKTLVSAQASAEELKQNATKEAQLVLRDAELKARQLVNDSYSEKQSIEQEIARLKNAEKDFRFKFRQLLDGYRKHLEEPAPPAAADGARADFARHAEEIKAAISREEAEEAPPVAAVAAEPEPDGAGAGEAAATAAEKTGEIPAPGRATIGDDELLTDVGGEVNENEFKW